MTSAVATSTSSSLPPPQENTGGELESSVAPRKFSHAMADALLALGQDRPAHVRGTASDAPDSAAEETKESAKKPDSSKRKAQDAGQIQSWLAALAGLPPGQSRLDPESGTVGGQGKGADTDQSASANLTTADQAAGSDTQQKANAGQQTDTKTQSKAPAGLVSAAAAGEVAADQSNAKDPAAPHAQTPMPSANAAQSESSVQGTQRTELSGREWEAALASMIELKPALKVRADERSREPANSAHDGKDESPSRSHQKAVARGAADSEGTSAAAQQDGGAGEDHDSSSTHAAPDRPAIAARLNLDISQSKSEASQSKALSGGGLVAYAERGMSAAPNAGAMQATQQVNENAGQAEQNLPVAAMAAQSAQPVEKDAKLRASQPDHLARNATGSMTAGAMTAQIAAGRDAPSRAEEATAPAPPPAHVRQAIGDAILGMKHLGDGSVSVTLKPGGQIQLALHLKMQHGRCEALAVLERGDFKTIGAEWSQLQSRLAQQGIRLAPLISAADHSSWFGSGNFSSAKQGRHQVTLEDLPVALIAKTPARKSGAPTVAANGREWWA